MADYAPNYTPRYRMRYSVLNRVHVATVRFARAEANPTGQGATLFSDLLNAVGDHLDQSFTVLGADVAGVDSDIFLPAATVPAAPMPTALAGDISYTPIFISFVGRSTSGARCSLYLYGLHVSPTAGTNEPNDYRITSAEAAWVASAVAALNGATTAPAFAIDGNAATWYPYANVGFNAYYQRKARRG